MFSTPYMIPGMVKGCYLIDSILLSTLECLYSECCLSVLLYYVNQEFDKWPPEFPLFTARPLIYNQTSTRFPPSTTLGVILKRMMIEDWKPNSSFDRYFQACAPTQCTYSDTRHTKNSVGILITLISTISGLTAALRLTAPLLVQLAFYLLELKSKKKPESNYN